MLASDLNNTEFENAKNPDGALHVEFFWHESVDSWASREASMAQQRNVVVKLPKAPHIRIMIPGDKNTEFVAAVTEAHKQRFPRQWLAWQIGEGLIGGDEDIPGWKLSEWSEINADMVRELLYLRFQTVEQLAGASDKQIQGIGIGGIGLREKARAALRNKMGAETKQVMEAHAAENLELKAKMAALEEKMALLLNATPATEKRGPGRPPKAEYADASAQG